MTTLTALTVAYQAFTGPSANATGCVMHTDLVETPADPPGTHSPAQPL